MAPAGTSVIVGRWAGVLSALNNTRVSTLPCALRSCHAAGCRPRATLSRRAGAVRSSGQAREQVGTGRTKRVGRWIVEIGVHSLPWRSHRHSAARHQDATARQNRRVQLDSCLRHRRAGCPGWRRRQRLDDLRRRGWRVAAAQNHDVSAMVVDRRQRQQDRCTVRHGSRGKSWSRWGTSVSGGVVDPRRATPAGKEHVPGRQ